MTGPANHVVGVYDHDDELISEVATYLAHALDQGGAAVVVATAAHRSALAAALGDAGFPVDHLTSSGHYRSLDAAATLRRFMHDGRVDAEAFESVIGTALADLAGPVQVFGEMVDLLWDEGNVSAAIELETLWNQLGARHSFALFCAYAMSSLETSSGLSALKEMCERHTDVLALHERTVEATTTAAHVRDGYDRLFVATPAVLRDVRSFVRGTLQAWGEQDMKDVAEIVASELATNAVKHAKSPFRVSIARSADAVVIAVRDASSDPPTELTEDAHHAGGRGVRLVGALSRAWGVRDEHDGKTVWAEVARAATA